MGDQVDKQRKPLKITDSSLLDSKVDQRGEKKRVKIGPPVRPKGVGPSEKNKLAMDSSLAYCYDYANTVEFGYGYTFLGYPELSQMSQRPEYRMMVETLAKEMTRKFVKLVSTGGDDDDDKGDKIKEIEKEFTRHEIRDKFRKLAEHDGFFGIGHLFIQTKNDLDTKLPLLRTKETFPKGSLVGFKNIEPLWTYPYQYNSNNPLDPTFFVPQTWFVMAQEVHRTRLLSAVSREVPDLLKPAYSFGGMALTQLAQPYVNNWLRTRDSVGDLIHNFSINVLQTNLESILQGGTGNDLFQRAQLFNNLRDNKGLMLVDKDTEELGQVNTPLSGLSELQAQAQEQMCSVATAPVVKLLGLTPSGLNTSTDGEIRTFYDSIHARQEMLFTKPMTAVLEAIQLDKFGEIDPHIGFEYVPLWQMDDEALSRIRKADADADTIYVDIGAVSAEEVRKKIAADPLSGYANIDTDVLPEPPPDPSKETDPSKVDEPPVENA